MKRRLELCKTSPYSLTAIRILLTALTIILFSVNNAFAVESARRPKDMVPTRRIQIKKQSEWIHEQFKDTAEFNAQRTDVLSKKRKRLIQEIEVLLTRPKLGPKEKRNIKFRIAKLLLEEYYSEIGLAYLQLEQRNQLAKQKGQVAPGKVDDSRAMVFLDKSRRHYFDLLRDYPEDEARDQMIYFLAITSLNKGLTQDAMEGFETLRVKHPKSRFVPDALIQLGDYHFEKLKYKEAEKYYEHMIALGHKPLLSYAVYKKAWCAYNTGRLQFALDNFKWVALNEDSIAKSSPLRIKNEALNDMALVFGDLKLLTDSKNFYRKFGPEVYRKGMESVGGIWQERGEYNLSVDVWKDLLALDATYLKNPHYELEISEAYKKQNLVELTLKQLFGPLALYVQGTEWSAKNQSEAAKSHLVRWEEEARKYSLFLHSTGQTTNSNHYFELAKSAYESYLQYFPKTKEAPALRYQLATLQFKFQDYLKATDNFILVSKETTDPKVKQDSVLNAVNALGQEMNRERKKAGLAEVTGTSSQKVAASSTFVEYSKVEERFMDLAALYADEYSTSNEAPEFIHETGYVQYLHHDHKRALKQFNKVVRKYPSNKVATTASFLILDIMNQQQDYDSMIEICKEFLRTGPKDSQYKGQVATILRQSELKRIQKWETNGEYETAANGYLNYVKIYGKEDRTLHETALYNAIGNFQKANLFAKSLQVQEDFLKTFPKSSRANDVLLEVAKTHEQMGLFAKAAREYEEFVKMNEKHPQAKAAFRMAGLLYWGAGLNKKAEVTLQKYAEQYPRDAKLVDMDLLEMYETSGMTAKQIGLHKQALLDQALHPSEYLTRSMALIELQAQKRGRVSTSALTELVEFTEKNPKGLKRTPASIEALAKLRIWANLKDENQFQRLRLRLPQARLESVLKAKLTLLKELETSYTRISKLGSPEWGLASIYKTARLYLTLANDVEAAPVPPSLKAKEVDKYREEIKNSMVNPFRRKAKVLAEGCVKQSENLHILSRWSAKCYSLVSKLDPERFQGVRTFYLPPLFMAVNPPGEDSLTEAGSMGSDIYPYESSFLFKSTDRQLSALKPLDALLASDELNDIDQDQKLPMLYSYKLLQEDQTKSVGRTIASEKPGTNSAPSFAYLNGVRLSNPKQAVALIQEAIKRDPNNFALQNLLALTYLESDNTSAAKVMWMSMMARSKKNAVIQNNLGVLAVLEGKESKGIKHFQDSIAMDPQSSSNSNLGFVALKYRNGSEALKYFQAALADGKKSAPLQIGQLVAMIQRGEQDSVRTSLTELTRGYDRDPYARLTASYYLLDKENDYSTAQQILLDYPQAKQAENLEGPFRKALLEADAMAKNEEQVQAINMKPVEAGVNE